MALNARQQRFVAEYLIDLNATQAAIRAGYSKKCAAIQGHENLRKPNIRDAIAAVQTQRAASLEIDAATVLREIANLAYSDIGDIIDFSGAEPRLRPANEITPAARRCISSMKVKRQVEGMGDNAKTVEITEFKLWEKPGKLQDLAKHLGLVADRHEHTGKDGGPLRVTVIEDENWYNNSAHEKVRQNGQHRLAQSASPSGNGAH